MAASLESAQNIIFTDSVRHEEVFTYIDLMDITVLPDTGYYMSPIKIFEYGAMGKAIIAPDVAPVRDVMVNGKDGILIKPEVKELTVALEDLIKDKTKRGHLAESFKKKVDEVYVWTKMAEKILNC